MKSEAELTAQLAALGLPGVTDAMDYGCPHQFSGVLEGGVYYYARWRGDWYSVGIGPTEDDAVENDGVVQDWPEGSDWDVFAERAARDIYALASAPGEHLDSKETK